MLQKHNGLEQIQNKWLKLVPTFGNNFLKEITMCYPVEITVNSRITFEFTVLPSMCDSAHQLNGGSAATILDSLLGWALGSDIGEEKQNYVTVDLDLVHLYPLLEGDKVYLKAQTVGHNDMGMSVVKGQLVRASDGLICVEAKQALMRIESVPVFNSIAPKLIPPPIKPVPKLVEFVALEAPMMNQETIKTGQLPQNRHSSDLFTKYLNMWTLISSVYGSNLYEFKATKDSTNALGVVHGGFLATAINACTLATKQKDTSEQRSSVVLHVSYMASARVGEVLELRTKTIAQTDLLAVIQAVITIKQTRVNVAMGYHTVLETSRPESAERLNAHL